MSVLTSHRRTNAAGGVIAPPSCGVLPIYGLTPFTMIDYPDHTACVIWFSGCNMRCPYCHNPQIVKGKGKLSIEYVLEFLKKRQGLLDGVVLSGGEASAYPGLVDLMPVIKSMGYAIKLDTNGLHPEKVRSLHTQGYIDFISLDYKAPPHKFKHVTGTDKYADFSKTLDYLCTAMPGSFEVRTTVHTDLLDENDLNLILQDLDRRGFVGTYAIQNFIQSDSRSTLGHLGPQSHIIDRNMLKNSQNYGVVFRNF